MAIRLDRLDGKNGFRLDGIDIWDQSGLAVAGAGDVNGDGVQDLLVGAFAGDPNGQRSGEAYVIFGTTAGFAPDLNLADLDGTNGFQLNGIDTLDAAGVAVDGLGDVNGDGIDDFIVGADWANPDGKERAGEAYVVFGTTAGFPAQIELADLDGTNGFRIDGIDVRDDLGWTVAGAGDVNGDGLDDIVTGAFRPDGWTGEAYVVFGSDRGFAADIDPSALDGTDGFLMHGIAPEDRAGWAVDGAGDLNGDGIDDVVVGAPEADADGRPNAGESYVVYGTRAGFSPTLAFSSIDGTNGFRIVGAEARDQSGRAVAGLGDVNGDGLDDLMVGSWNADVNGNSNAGASYVVYGSRAGFGASLDLGSLDGTNGFRIDGVAANDRSGYAVASAGDFNGDGIGDMVIGAWKADRAGDAYVVYGTAEGFPASIDLSSLDGTNGFAVEGLHAEDRGGRVAGAGDLNGDGYDDVVIGAWRADADGRLHAGESYVIFGHATGTGAERIVGTPGDDVLAGLAGNDTLLGLGGGDRLFGGTGADGIAGGAGHDDIFGGTGRDRLLGGTGRDSLLGWTGDDTLAGGAGRDALYGGTGHDRLSGGAADDRLLGGAGNDRLSGGGGNDRLLGGTGHDTLSGDGGNDRLTGGAGADVFVFAPAGGSDLVTDFGVGADRLDVSAYDVDSGADALALGTQHGGDVIFALGAGTRLVLAGHLISDLAADDFLV